MRRLASFVGRVGYRHRHRHRLAPVGAGTSAAGTVRPRPTRRPRPRASVRYGHGTGSAMRAQTDAHRPARLPERANKKAGTVCTVAGKGKRPVLKRGRRGKG